MVVIRAKLIAEIGVYMKWVFPTFRGAAGMTRVIAHDRIMIGSEVYDFNLSWYRRPKCQDYSPLQSVQSSIFRA